MNAPQGSVLVTGADGFVGRALCARLRAAGKPVIGVLRSANAEGMCAIGDIEKFDQWQPILSGVDVVVHLAARAHILNETADDPLEAFRRINVEATASLARAAVDAGVRRFVFVSSIGVNGARTQGRPFTEDDPPQPTEPYAISKLEAERSLREIEESSALEIVLVRPPLIYGPGVKGNFVRLMKLVQSGLPLPFGAVDNRRSFIGLENLCDFLLTCVDHPRAPGELFLVADGEDVSTARLLEMLAKSMGRVVRLPSLPLGSLRMLAMLAGRRVEFDRLSSSLQVDASRARSRLDWIPRRTFEQGVDSMAHWYMNEGRE